MGKKLATLLSLVMSLSLMQLPACATDVITFPAADLSADAVTITGTHPSGEGKQVTVSVTRDGETEPYYWFGTTAGTGGNFEFKFKMNRQLDSNGVYNVKLGGAGLTAVSTQYSFYAPEDEGDILSRINGATDYSGVQPVVETKGESFGIMLSDEIFSTLDAKTAVYESLVGRSFTSTDAVKRAFYMSAAAQQLNEETSSNGAVVLNLYKKHLNLDMARGSLYNRIRSDECKDLVHRQFVGNNLVLKNADTLADEFDKVCALAIINDADTSNRSELIGFIEEFNREGYSDISLTAYNAAQFDDTEKLNVASLIIAAKADTYFASFADVSQALSDACTATINARSGDGEADGDDEGSSSGGSGGRLSVQNQIVESINIDKTAETNAEFTDLKDSHWAYNSVKKLVAKGIISGTGNNTFEPDRGIKREEFVKILVGAFNIYEASAELSFTDVKADDWYTTYIKAAFAKGIINGVSNDSFGVGQTITREDLATMIYRVVNTLGLKVEASRGDAAFKDNNSISDYAKEAVNYLYKTEIINGISESEFAPKQTATRAMAAELIASLMERSGVN